MRLWQRGREESAGASEQQSAAPGGSSAHHISGKSTERRDTQWRIGLEQRAAAGQIRGTGNQAAKE